MIINHDLVWLQGPPSIAAVHYHKHLRYTHVLYCPDDPPLQAEKSVRELARAIVAVLDSNKKKLAVHFMYPCAEKKLSEIVRAIYRIRPQLRIDCYVLQTSALQKQLLLGWSMGAAAASVPNADLWLRRCLVPFSPAAFITPDGCSSVHQLGEYKQLFCISDRDFAKRALFVNVTPSLCATAQSSKAGIAFNDHAIAAIQGWADATAQLSIAGTLIMLVDEKTIYGNFLKDNERKIFVRQKRLLADARKSTLASFAKLQTKCPVYLYARDYFSRAPEDIYDQIACMQHRHHLGLSSAVCLHHSRKDAVSSQGALYFSSIQHVYLNETMNQNRAAWKMHFTSAIHSSLAQVEPKQDGLIFLKPQDLAISIDSDAFLLPLVKGWEPTRTDQTRHEEYEDRYIHSVTISDLQVFDSWKNSMMSGCTVIKHPAESSIPEELDSTGLKPNNRSKPAAAVYEGDPSELADSFAERLFPQNIKKYINNDKWYSRGEEILHQLYDLEFSGDENVLSISAMLKGTAKDPYHIAISFVAEDGDSDIEIIKGHCDCPVGKEGKCKHCASVLLRFMINTAEFEYSMNISVPYETGAITTIPKTDDRQEQETKATQGTTEQTYTSGSMMPVQKQYSSTEDASLMSLGTTLVADEVRTVPSPSGSVIPPKPRTKSRFLPWTAASANDPPEKKGRRRKATESEEDGEVAEKKSKRKPAKKRQAADEFLLKDEPRPKRRGRPKKKAPTLSPAPSRSPSLSPTQNLPRPISPPLISIPNSPRDISMGSAPREMEDNIDSDATEDGLGPVMGPTQRTTSWMSVDSPGPQTNIDVGETRSSLHEARHDNGKEDESSPGKNAMDDLFDEIGL